MKRTTIRNRFALTVAAACVLGAAPAAKADNKCSNATLKGSFAYTNTGFITSPTAEAGPFAGVGLQTFDGNGGTTATGWVSQNGNILQVIIKGTYAVNPDCTGTLALQVSVLNPPMSLSNQVFFVIDSGGASFQAINQDRGTVITTNARKQFAPGD